MRYDYEFKKKCVDLYQQGIYADTPEGVSDESFKLQIRRWSRMMAAHGPSALMHKKLKRKWSSEEKLQLVCEVLGGAPLTAVAINAGIVRGVLQHWVKKYQLEGYNGLVDKKKGRKPKDPAKMKKVNINNPRKIQETEYEELIRLRKENALIKAEIEVIKKEIALREQKEAAQLKARKQRSSRSSATKDTN